MKCSQYCFDDSHLKYKIKEFGTLGNCDYCNSIDVKIIDITDSAEDLEIILKYYESTEPLYSAVQILNQNAHR